jgi:hypothetical protein
MAHVCILIVLAVIIDISEDILDCLWYHQTCRVENFRMPRQSWRRSAVINWNTSRRDESIANTRVLSRGIDDLSNFMFCPSNIKSLLDNGN